VSFSGDLDLLSAQKLRGSLLEALTAPVVVLDLSACSFCDSSGLRTVMEASSRANATGCRFRVAGVGIPIARAFELSGVGDVLSVFPDVDSALRD
jgi:anti-sigma B factor antagonist